MAEFPAFTPFPARVHGRAREFTGHHPRWIRRPYVGVIYCISHFRICSYCSCIHPSDLIELLDAGESRLEETPRPGKYLFCTPNPAAGDLVRMGSTPGRIFARDPTDIPGKMKDPAKRSLVFTPTSQERLSGHFDRPALEIAPAMIVWPFYAEHTTNRQWPEIWAAASQGAEHATSLPSPSAH